MLDLVHEARFVDLAVPQVYATLLDEGRYLCSPRTMYRILDAQGEVRERPSRTMRAQIQAALTSSACSENLNRMSGSQMTR